MKSKQDWIQTPITVDLDYLHAADASHDNPHSLDQDNGISNNSNRNNNNHHHHQSSGGGQQNTNVKHQKQRLQYLAVPDDASRVNSVCPICQERFEMKWLDEAQEWVWMDAVKLGDRVFHASCHREVSGGGAGGRGTPPDGRGVLGKRKAEVSFS
jgi:pre-mRNA cleavage complex 2 protein Pcf11